MSNNAHELSYRLLNALDKEYNVVDMQAVNEIISILEKFNITKELLETTRLGKYVNELRRKTTDPTLARRAKVLVKRWRDLVMPAVASPAHTGPGSNRSSAERTYRRFGGTPLTSPALSMHTVSPAVPSPRLPTRPAWGGYESDSQDVILVDDDPPAAPPAPLPPLPHAPLPHAPLPFAHKPTTPPVKRPPSPEIVVQDDKKAKRDKKPKKRRGHSRAGSGTETTTPATSPPMPIPMPTPAATATPTAPALAQTWGARNGSAPERRRNGWRRETPDPYAALVNRLPPAGAKKVKTTKELLEQLQSKGNAPLSRASSPGDPASPDVMVIEPDTVSVKVESPLRNGTGGDLTIKEEPTVERREEEMEPLEEEREWVECTCGWDDEVAGGVEAERTCPAAAVGAARRLVRPRHVRALHHTLLPGVNGTRAPALPQRFAVRAAADPARPGLFASVVPLYKYTDYADDYCAKNMAHVPICTELPWTEFAPAPPSPPPPPDPPELRPYPWPDGDPTADPVAPAEPAVGGSPSPESAVDAPAELKVEYPTEIEAEAVGVPTLEPSERLKAPLLSTEEATQFGAEPASAAEVAKSFASEQQEHRTVERTKGDVDGRALYGLCRAALRSVPWSYGQAAPAPELRSSQLEAPDGDDVLEEALALAYDDEPARPARDELGRPRRPERFAEWHEPARLGDLVALPYVVLD